MQYSQRNERLVCVSLNLFAMQRHVGDGGAVDISLVYEVKLAPLSTADRSLHIHTPRRLYTDHSVLPLHSDRKAYLEGIIEGPISCATASLLI